MFFNKIIFFIAISLTAINSFAQENKISLFQNINSPKNQFKELVRKATFVTYNKTVATQLIKSSPKAINFSFYFEGKEWELILEKSKLLSPNFSITTGKNNGNKLPIPQTALHYKGYVKGKPHSFVAISILEEKLIGVVADELGNINIGAVNTSEARQTSEHVIYRESDLLSIDNSICGTVENNTAIPTFNALATPTINTEPINMYFEADYQLFQNKGNSISNTVNYVTSLFNVVNVLYENDSVNIQISGLKIWDTPDPYMSYSSMQSILPVFYNNINAQGFAGDFAHLLTFRDIGGGIGQFGGLCRNASKSVAVSGTINEGIAAFPIYTRSVLRVAHEIGHNLGSPHTHSCDWPGGAIDNCATPEGTCAIGPAPINGGTIMSYCRLTSYGVNFLNGFGPLPSSLIRNNIRTSYCRNPAIYFLNSIVNVNEENADVENGCFDYKIYSIVIKIGAAPSQPVNITLLPTPIGNLQMGVNKDLEIITPLNFTLDSLNLNKTISVKVYNDDIIESLERLELNFSINANGGNAFKRDRDTTFRVYIISDDHRPDSTINQIIWKEDFDTISTGLGNWTQTIIHGNNSPNRWIVGNNDNTSFSGKAAYISNNNNLLAYSGTSANDSTIVRLESPIINTEGFTAINLSFSYKCMGEYVYQSTGPNTGIGTLTDFGKVYYSIDSGYNWTVIPVEFYDKSSKSRWSNVLNSIVNNRKNFKIAFQWNNNTSVVNSPPFIIDSIILKGTSIAPIQSTIHPNNINEGYLGPNQTVHFYNPVTKNIIATIENKSSFDYGCTSVEIVRTGNSATNINGEIPSNKISDKVYKVTTENYNAAAPYNLKLYYTAEEITGWKSATGNGINDISIVKTVNNLSQPPIVSSLLFSSLRSNLPYGVNGNIVSEAVFTGISNTATFALMKPYGNLICADDSTKFKTNIIGTNYQWQVNNGIGYIDINNDAIYIGTSTDSLKIILPPHSYFDNKYRCKITTTFGIVYSEEFILKYGTLWNGTVSTSWENPLNWSCNKIPDVNTDVYILNGTPFAPILNASTSIRSVTILAASNLTIQPGAILNLKK